MKKTELQIKPAYEYSRVITQYEDLKDERSEWEAEWRNISDFLLPGRGIYQTYSKPRKRKLTSHRVINTVAEDALYVLTSGMHGGLTSPSRPWFDLAWADADIKEIDPLKAWLQDCTLRLHSALQASNFYSIINSFYVEYAGFGTSCTYVGEDTDKDGPPFRFELLTAGEYVFSEGASGKPAVFMRPIFKTPRQVVELFPDTVSNELKKRVMGNQAGTDKADFSILECIFKDRYQGKDYTQVFYERTSLGQQGVEHVNTQRPLDVSGFYEFPYPLARWGTIGSDIYGIGPGSRALPDIKRLQEMEKAFLMATHKGINPPLNAPGRMRGKLDTLPGGYNYYSNPGEQVTEIYKVRFDYSGVGSAIERVEDRIKRNFFNDIFLTAARDPNASPLKATQVNVQEQEKMLRLGPVIERLQFEYFQPVIERCFNIMLRKELMLPLPEEYIEMAGEYNITLVSPLATAQRAVALKGVNSFMAFVGNIAQFDQSVMDNIDGDEAVRDHADISGVRLGILRPMDQVRSIRKKRAEAQAKEKKRQESLAMAGAESELNQQKADTRKTESEAGLNLVTTQRKAAGME